ncbi:MAG TPA: hypothetical protein VGN63_11385 [Flavisolibacter sp.]|jgi:hypothetical protein|nr:hypothetical protein [Flavisolibacter sp.]
MATATKKSTATKKNTTKKASSKKSATRKSAAKKTTAKKPAAKKSVAKKSATKKGSSRKNKLGVKNSLVNNINAHKKRGDSKSKKTSTVSKKAYQKMEQNWSKEK